MKISSSLNSISYNKSLNANKAAKSADRDNSAVQRNAENLSFSQKSGRKMDKGFNPLPIYAVIGGLTAAGVVMNNPQIPEGQRADFLMDYNAAPTVTMTNMQTGQETELPRSLYTRNGEKFCQQLLPGADYSRVVGMEEGRRLICVDTDKLPTVAIPANTGLPQR